MTVISSKGWRPFLVLALTLSGIAMAVAALYPNLQLPGGTGYDLWFHGAGYGLLVVMGGLLLPNRLRWVTAAMLLYSTLLEGLQYVVPGRTVSLTDLSANLLGILVGLVIMVLWRRQRGGLAPENVAP